MKTSKILALATAMLVLSYFTLCASGETVMPSEISAYADAELANDISVTVETKQAGELSAPERKAANDENHLLIFAFLLLALSSTAMMIALLTAKDEDEKEEPSEVKPY